ncbi:ribosomal RNA processing protein 36 homolog [Venturia canescens]|uniref:ribosomal RNA processing protein 36 homolog n=1 Tax=Venturia canescens TaxID=32260 RepID=UPI001C9BEC7A|nr:ribosomal RNA processing protein 36 homolog [Venturia canescens]
MEDGEISLEEDKDQSEIRQELSRMSFQDLEKLKEKLGSKVYNEAMFGKKRIAKELYKRENKNRPREMSSKKPVSRFYEISTTKKNIPRDPRFDGLCGTFNEKAFKNAYSFVSELKERDLKALRKQLNDTQDPKEIKKIKYLIQRLENQLREEKKCKELKKKDIEEKQEISEAIKQGEKPVFKKKSEKKILNLVSQYEDLKNSGKLKKHIQRLRKKNMKRDRKKFAVTDM